MTTDTLIELLLLNLYTGACACVKNIRVTYPTSHTSPEELSVKPTQYSDQNVFRRYTRSHLYLTPLVCNTYRLFVVVKQKTRVRRIYVIKSVGLDKFCTPIKEARY